MGALFLRLYVLLAFTFAIFIVGIINIETILKGTIEDTLVDISVGTLYFFDKRLSATPREQW